jgi:hypothetical protein
MTARLGEYRPRVAVDTDVLMEAGSLRRLLLAADLGLFEPIWSPQVAGELASAGLWRLGRRGRGHRSITTEQYATYRHRLYQRIEQIDLRFEVVRSAPTAPVDDEVAWAEARDWHGLHVQVMARTARADCVVSWNHRDFPARQLVSGRPCGELCGVLWMTPDQLPALGRDAAEASR